jgi:hypothetical protein
MKEKKIIAKESDEATNPGNKAEENGTIIDKTPSVTTASFALQPISFDASQVDPVNTVDQPNRSEWIAWITHWVTS